ncbi:MAG: hypothetical protein IPI35_17185 [Deltaproteobacteria bacterium]|nr:hypothetical protein [Deltaproteobacteria bacterium]
MSTPPPSPPEPSLPSEEDLKQPPGAQFIGLLMLFASMSIAATGLQVLMVAYWPPPPQIFVGPAMLMVLGLAGMWTGAQASTGEHKPVLRGVGLAVSMAIIGGLWTLYALYLGLFSLLPLVAVGLIICAGFLLVLTLPAARRYSLARAKLDAA